jgi:hypothetical protein
MQDFNPKSMIWGRVFQVLTQSDYLFDESNISWYGLLKEALGIKEADWDHFVAFCVKMRHFFDKQKRQL